MSISCSHLIYTYIPLCLPISSWGMGRPRLHGRNARYIGEKKSLSVASWAIVQQPREIQACPGSCTPKCQGQHWPACPRGYSSPEISNFTVPLSFFPPWKSVLKYFRLPNHSCSMIHSPLFFFFTNQRDIYLPIRISDQY